MWQGSDRVTSFEGGSMVPSEPSCPRWIPVITQGWGGIVVGLIAKTSGSVRKGAPDMKNDAWSLLLEFIEDATSSKNSYQYSC